MHRLLPHVLKLGSKTVGGVPHGVVLVRRVGQGVASLLRSWKSHSILIHVLQYISLFQLTHAEVLKLSADVFTFVSQ